MKRKIKLIKSLPAEAKNVCRFLFFYCGYEMVRKCLSASVPFSGVFVVSSSAKLILHILWNKLDFFQGLSGKNTVTAHELNKVNSIHRSKSAKPNFPNVKDHQLSVLMWWWVVNLWSLSIISWRKGKNTPKQTYCISKYIQVHMCNVFSNCFWISLRDI